MTYYVAIESNDTLDVMHETNTLFDALCHFNTLNNHHDDDVDEIEIGKYINDEMSPIDYIEYK